MEEIINILDQMENNIHHVEKRMVDDKVCKINQEIAHYNQKIAELNRGKETLLKTGIGNSCVVKVAERGTDIQDIFKENGSSLG